MTNQSAETCSTKMQKFQLRPETFGERDRDMRKRETAWVQSQPERASTVKRSPLANPSGESDNCDLEAAE